jgi:hypothetical protein
VNAVHYSSVTTEWSTPIDVFNGLNAEFKFDLDPCPLGKEIRFLRGRLKFGDAKNSAPFPSMIVVFEKKDLNNGQ